ncbi:hypothetical protein BIY24_01850 [Halobacteriovorax marinus]|uniref:class I SAM-dependent methyltransferase n=1 Tax=Halobacteriovorax marinus TaxID=97084 RepID=UPI000BC2D215|nr:class I SAM-dependent methyltransferase [Halobacteriovorax marinus]ATH06724.1 hypothetical protein BIY24_01850 [Halobacteriovorax marinus]
MENIKNIELPKHDIAENSTLMKIALSLGFTKIAWSLRRLHCPVKNSDLVLEIGSGGNPYFRSNVCADAYVETRERYFSPLISDRPTVITYAENMPFKDKAFDFIIASHVLEHSKDPEKFLQEIQRVAKAGYIEVPDAFMERLTCYIDHVLEITDYNGSLLITKKEGYIQDQQVYDLYRNKVSKVYPEFIAKHPFKHHVRFYWSEKSGGIQYSITNPKYEFNWEPSSNNITDSWTPSSPLLKLKRLINTYILASTRKFFSQNKRNKNIDVVTLLKCNKCNSENLTKKGNSVLCNQCHHSYELNNNMLLT